ncbi:MAG: RidA family protein [Bacillota bacterium]|nr:RidA family protein [Bacillota bacterium]MDW7684087.1 RidA family protein [Bacillota bacterium]
MGLTLPAVAAPVGAYVPAVRTGRYIYTSGQLPLVGGSLRYKGKVGLDLTPEEGYEAARICALNALAAAASVVDDTEQIVRVVKVNGFVNTAPDFTAHAGVINGASELLGKIFMDGHARAAVGMASLPLDAAVELEMILEVTE